MHTLSQVPPFHSSKADRPLPDQDLPVRNALQNRTFGNQSTNPVSGRVRCAPDLMQPNSIGKTNYSDLPRTHSVNALSMAQNDMNTFTLATWSIRSSPSRNTVWLR